jgi:hypothetical protein
VRDDGVGVRVAQHELVLGERRVHVIPQGAELAVEQERRVDGGVGRLDGRSKVRPVSDRHRDEGNGRARRLARPSREAVAVGGARTAVDG